MHVIAEGLTLNLPGLSTLPTPLRTARFEQDSTRGVTRRQMLAGFRPNQDPEQIEYLRRFYDYRAEGNEAFTRGTLLVLPDAVEALKIELAPLVERGLSIQGAVCGSEDMNMTAYRALLANARCLRGSDKPAYLTRVETMISELGKDITPLDLRARIQASKIPGNVKEGMCEQLWLIKDLVKPGVRLNDVFLEPHPVFVLLESCYLSPDVLTPYQTVLSSALCRPLRDGTHPHRWIFTDEFNKFAQNAVMIERSREIGQERRHNPYSWAVNGQRCTGFDAAFTGQNTIMAVFRVTSHKEIRAIKDRCGLLEDIPDEVFMNLKPGQCIIAAQQATGGGSVFIVTIRPSVSHAGGETLRATSGG